MHCLKLSDGTLSYLYLLYIEPLFEGVTYLCALWVTTTLLYLFFKCANPVLFFFIFVFSIQLTTLNMQNKYLRPLDSNRGPLVSEATALPTDPKPQPISFNFKTPTQTVCYVHQFLASYGRHQKHLKQALKFANGRFWAKCIFKWSDNNEWQKRGARGGEASLLPGMDAGEKFKLFAPTKCYLGRQQQNW